VHIIVPDLGEFQSLRGIDGLDYELSTEYIRELGAVPVPTAGGLLLVVVEVGSLYYAKEKQSRATGHYMARRDAHT
jgi:hypothetical protein